MSSRINGKTITAAAKAAVQGQEKEVTFADGDKGITGFGIRVKGKRADWVVRVKGHKISIAELSVFGEKHIDSLRELAVAVKSQWRAGRTNEEVRVMVDAFLAQLGVRSVTAAANDAEVVVGGAWTWERLRDEYLAEMKVTKTKVYYDNLRSLLGAIPGGAYEKDFKPITGMAVKNITQAHLKKVRKNTLMRGGMVGIVAKGKIRAAELLTSALTNAFAWGHSHEEITGVSSNPMIGFPAIVQQNESNNKANVDGSDEQQVEQQIFRRPYMSLQQIYDFLWVWLPKQDFIPEAKLAVTLQGLTGQRIETVTASLTREFRRVYHQPARFVWALGPDKTGSYRVLPLPDWASFEVSQALQNRAKRNVKSKRSTTDVSRNPFLFPQTRVRKKGDAPRSHISNHNVNDIFQLAREPGGPLAGTKFASHDLRRGFVTHMSMMGLQLGLETDDPEEAEEFLKKVTHKDEGKTSVIALHYNLGSQEKVKLRILKLWESMILNAYGPEKRPDLRVFEFDDPTNDAEMEEYRQWYANNEAYMQEVSNRQDLDGHKVEQR